MRHIATIVAFVLAGNAAIALSLRSSPTQHARSNITSRPLAGQHHRRLKALAACAQTSRQLLTNGYFNLADPHDMRNQLVAATMANDAYPWAKQFGFDVMDVVYGLTAEQISRYQELFTGKYMKLGATSVVFVDQYSPTADVAAHAAVIGTARSVFVVFRGTTDIGQGWLTADISSVPHVAFNKTLQIYQAPYKSTMLIWQWLLDAVKKAVAETDNPTAAQVYATGHSLGGASASLSALLLKEQGFNIGGVYTFGPYKSGTTCTPDADCWVSIYDRHLANVTSFWWNNQDPIPALLDSALGTTFANSIWGHVPRNTGWMRVVGDVCMQASGTPLAESICPPAVDAADGIRDNVCSQTTVTVHMPWVYLQKVARCALFDNPHDESSRMDSCRRSTVWEVLLGLPTPTGVSKQANIDRLIELVSMQASHINGAMYGLHQVHGRP